MEAVRSRVPSYVRSISPPFVTHYWLSIFRGSPEGISLPNRSYGGHLSFMRIRKDNGAVVSVVAVLLFSSALRIMDRAERNALPSDSDPLRFRNAFMQDFSMLAVTGAIVAQVAITSLALPSLNQVYWISNAAFIVSLVCACLSVFFSTTMARNLSSLDTPNDVRDWLSKPAPKIARLEFEKTIRPRLVIAHLASDDERLSLQAAIVKFLADNKWKEASFYSCAMLSAPSILLNLSLALFLIALGIYLGTVWSRSLDPIAGDVASRAVMICYVVGIVSGMAIFFGPSNRKDAELAFLRGLIIRLDSRPTAISTENSDLETGHQSGGEKITRQQIPVESQGDSVRSS